MTNEEIVDAAGCESDAGGMLAALLDTKWIDGEDGSYRLHDWSEHQRWVIFAPKRKESARKAAEIRWHKKQVKQKVNAPRMRPACEGDAGSNAPSPAPDPNPSPIPKGQKPIVTRPGNGRFTIPTLDEVSEHVKARGGRIDPIKFHAHYTSNGWKVGKNPMKSWKAAVVTWERSANQ